MSVARRPATLLHASALAILLACAVSGQAPPAQRAPRPFLNALSTAAASRPANASRPFQAFAAGVAGVIRNATTPPPPKPPRPPPTVQQNIISALAGQSQPSGAVLAPVIQRSLTTMLDLPQVDALATMFGVNKTAVIGSLSTDLAAAIARGALAGTDPAETVVTLVPVALSSMSRSMNGTAAAPLVTALAGSAQSIPPSVVLALMQGMASLVG